jgi:ABC-type antimicrobial peptide transport system permease subunit
MARKYWPDRNPVGQVIHIGPGLGSNDQGVVEIIGVVGDVRDRLNIEPSPVMYQTVSQISDSAIGLVQRMQPAGLLVRTAPGSRSGQVAGTVETALLTTSGLPVSRSRTLEELALASTARENFSVFLLGLFASFALLLAAAGIYSVMSYSISQRRHEIAIRAAIGAGCGDILRLVFSQALWLTFRGASIGILASAWLTQFMRTELFETSPFDWFTFGVAPLILFATAIVAAFLPALRASRIVPSVGLLQD